MLVFRGVCLRANLGMQCDLSLSWQPFRQRGCCLIPIFSVLIRGPTACQKRYPPLLKRYSQGSTLLPRGFPQVFVCCAHVACIRQEPTIWTSNHGHRIIRTCPKHCKARSRTTKKDTYCMSHRAPWHALAPFECNACRSGDLFFFGFGP